MHVTRSKSRGSKIKKMARHMGTCRAISAPSFSLSWSNGAEGQFSIKGQSSLDEQSNLFIESLRPVVVSIPRNETSPADHRATTKKYFFAARVHMEQYKNECERESTLLGYLRGRERARVKMESVFEACVWERERESSLIIKDKVRRDT